MDYYKRKVSETQLQHTLGTIDDETCHAQIKSLRLAYIQSKTMHKLDKTNQVKRRNTLLDGLKVQSCSDYTKQLFGFMA